MIVGMLPCIQPDESYAERFLRARALTREIFACVSPAAFDARPIPLRHPLRFYEGHLAAFNLNTLHHVGLLPDVPDPAMCTIFARGIDPEDEAAAAQAAISAWPSREAVAAFVAAADRITLDKMHEARRDDVLFTCIEHEEMHQETLAYLVHQLPDADKRAPAGYAPRVTGAVPATSWVKVPAGVVPMGAPADQPFGWDNEYPAHDVPVAAFELASHKVTNAEYLAFVEAGGYARPELWSAEGRDEILGAGLSLPPFWVEQGGRLQQRSLFWTIDVPPQWPVVVSYHEAEAYARWQNGRLPTEAEFQRAAYGDDAVAAAPRAETFPQWDFHPLADTPNGLGLCEMTTNGWEWTSTVFAGFAGFRARPYYPGYSADFFDGRHNVIKGASPATPPGLRRPSFRNWFRRSYRWAYTTFRLARDLP